MEELIDKYITELSPNVIAVAIIIICALGWIIFKNRKTISDFFTNLYNRKKNKEDFLKIIYENQAEIKQIIENRNHDREQSYVVQKELTDSQKELASKQNELSDLVSDIIKSSETRDEQIKNLTIAQREVMADRINQKYKYYIKINGIPEDEIDEFTNLHMAYKGCGGNHSGDAKYEYSINHLPIIPVETKLKFDKSVTAHS